MRILNWKLGLVFLLGSQPGLAAEDARRATEGLVATDATAPTKCCTSDGICWDAIRDDCRWPVVSSGVAPELLVVDQFSLTESRRPGRRDLTGPRNPTVADVLAAAYDYEPTVLAARVLIVSAAPTRSTFPGVASQTIVTDCQFVALDIYKQTTPDRPSSFRVLGGTLDGVTVNSSLTRVCEVGSEMNVILEASGQTHFQVTPLGAVVLKSPAGIYRSDETLIRIFMEFLSGRDQ